MTRGMRALTAVTIFMAVLIVVGTGALIAIIIHRSVSPSPATVAATAPAKPLAVDLNEPAGTRIAAMAAVGDRLALELQGGGADRVALVDPRSGVVTGRITLGH